MKCWVLERGNVMKTQKLLTAAAIVCIAANIAVVLLCCFGGPSAPESMVSTDDLSGHDMYVYNVTCLSDKLKHRTVEDAVFIDEITELCARATPFRPGTTSDLIMGIDRNHVYVRFENETDFYWFTLSGIKDKIDPGSAHRDRPVFDVIKYTFDDAGRRYEEIGCFCILPAADYAALYERLQRYSGGEIV